MWDLNRGIANSFWDLVIKISIRQMYFLDIYSNLWKVKLWRGTAMYFQDGFLYLIVTRHKLTVHLHATREYSCHSWADRYLHLMDSLLWALLVYGTGATANSYACIDNKFYVSHILLPLSGHAECYVQLLCHLQAKGCWGSGLDVYYHNWSLRMLCICTVRKATCLNIYHFHKVLLQTLHWYLNFQKNNMIDL
jgi:hypothetical protein